MYSPRLFAVLLIAVGALALPAEKPDTTLVETSEEPEFFLFPFIGNLFAPLWKFFPDFSEIGPNISSDEKTLKVALKVNGFQLEDLKVKVLGDMLLIKGSQSSHMEHSAFATQFLHTYSLPANTTADDVTAELTPNEYLVVTATASGKHPNTEEKEIIIKRTDENYSDKNVDASESAPELDDDRREPTTPANKETQENEISQDNEIAKL